jgi:predicted transcriptional regulator
MSRIRATNMVSVKTYNTIGHITAELQRQIMALFKIKYVWTRKEIAVELKLETSTVSGRVRELVQGGSLIETATIRCPITGRMVGGLTLSMLAAA